MLLYSVELYPTDTAVEGSSQGEDHHHVPLPAVTVAANRSIIQDPSRVPLVSEAENSGIQNGGDC